MKNTLRLVICFSLTIQFGFTNLALAKSEPNYTKIVHEALPLRKGSAKKILSSLKPVVSTEDFNFLTEVSKKLGEEEMKKELSYSLKGRQMLVSSNKKVYSFEVVDPEKSIFKVNGKELKLEPEDSKEEVWEKIRAVLPKEKASWLEFNFRNILLPKAHAQPVAMAGMTVFAGVVAVAVAWTKRDKIKQEYRNWRCPDRMDALNNCRSTNRELRIEQRKVDMGERPQVSGRELTFEDYIGGHYINRLNDFYRTYNGLESRAGCGGVQEELDACKDNLDELLSVSFDGKAGDYLEGVRRDSPSYPTPSNNRLRQQGN